MMKLMHFNSSCSYAGICNLLETYGIDLEDTELALKMKLPFLYQIQDGVYLGGVMLQSAEEFNLALKPMGFELIERVMPASEVPDFLKTVKSAMLGIRMNPHQKHAVNYTGIAEDCLMFLNNHHTNEKVTERLKFTEVELIHRLDEMTVIALLKKCDPQSISFVPLLKESMCTVTYNIKEIAALCRQKKPVHELRAKLNSLFRMLFLDGLEMMKLIKEEQLAKKMTSVQNRLLAALKQPEDKVIELDEWIRCELLDEIKDELLVLIQRQIDAERVNED